MNKIKIWSKKRYHLVKNAERYLIPDAELMSGSGWGASWFMVELIATLRSASLGKHTDDSAITAVCTSATTEVTATKPKSE